MKVYSRNWISLLLTFAFSWVFIGSLVNFHQVHVLSKHLPHAHWTFVKPKTGEKQEQQNFGNPSRDINTANDLMADGQYAGTRLISCSQSQFIKVLNENIVNPADQSALPCLRAPPLV